MAADLEEQKKLVLPYLQRAQEIQAVDPCVAYYCRLFAIDQGLQLPKRHKDIDGLLHATLVRLEKDKAQLGVRDKAADLSHCMAFALNIFRKADRKDRAGQSDANTARAFYAASIFLDILNQFAPLEAPLIEKQRYAVWRAAEINKAIREGRAPAPPPRDEEADALMAAGTGADAGAGGGGSFSSSAGPSDGWAAGPSTGAAGDSGAFPGPQAPGTSHTKGPDHLPSPPPHAPGAFSASDFTLPSLPDLPPLPPGDPNPPGAPDDSNDSDFFDLPAPPTGISRGNSLNSRSSMDAPAGPAVAACHGPRFRPGSRVLMGAGAGAPPLEGTVGMVTSHGPDPVYKVALKDQLVDVADSKLAPNLVAGKRVTYVAAAGRAGVGAVVLAAPVGTWPPTYLIRCDDGHEVAAPSSNLTMTGEGAQAAAPKSPQQQQQRSPRVSDGSGTPSTSAPGGGYPSLGGGPGGAYPSPHSGFDTNAGFMGAAPTAPPPTHPPAPHIQYPSPYGPPAAPPAGPGRDSQYPQHSAPSAPAATAAAASASHHIPSSPPASSAATTAAAAAPQLFEAVPGFQPSLLAIQEAQKAAKYAVSSLSFDDVSGGVKYLTDALRLLTQPAATPAADGASKAAAARAGRR